MDKWVNWSPTLLSVVKMHRKTNWSGGVVGMSWSDPKDEAVLGLPQCRLVDALSSPAFVL